MEPGSILFPRTTSHELPTYRQNNNAGKRARDWPPATNYITTVFTKLVNTLLWTKRKRILYRMQGGTIVERPVCFGVSARTVRVPIRTEAKEAERVKKKGKERCITDRGRRRLRLRAWALSRREHLGPKAP